MKAIKPFATVVVALAFAGCVDTGGTRSVVQAGPTTLQAVQTAVFSQRCATSGCHQVNGPFGLDLSSGAAYSTTVGVMSAELPGFERVTPFDAANSYLYMKISGDPRILGDPMPASGPLLTSQQLQLVEDWINSGAIP